MPHRHAPQPFPAPAVSGRTVRAAPVPPLVRTHSSQNESDPERPICEADRFNRPSFARYSEKISEDRKTAKPKERDRRKRKHRSVSDRQHTAFPHRSQRNRKETGTKRINRGNENGRSPCHRRQHAVSRTLRHALRTASYGARHSAPSTPRTTVPTNGQPYAIGPAPAPESSARISERRKKHEPAYPYDRIGDRQRRIEKTYGKPSCLAVRGHPRRPGPQPGPCIFRHSAFRIGGNQAFASLRPRRWASRSIHPISTTPNTILSANSTLMFRFLSRTFSAMKPACNRMMTIVP